MAALTMNSHQLCEQQIDDFYVYHRLTVQEASLSNSLCSRNSLPTAILPSQYNSSLHRSSFGLIPGHEVIETSVRFVGINRIARHCEFKLHVDTGKEQFVLHKRFSQFRDLRKQLLLNSKAATGTDEKGSKVVCRNGACLQIAQHLPSLKFPRRRMKLHLCQNDDINTANARQVELRSFVEFLLTTYRKASKRQALTFPIGKLLAFRSICNYNVPVSDTSSSSPSNEVVMTTALMEPPIQVSHADRLYTISEDKELART
ncbi:Phox homologous domain [Plasmopara halstedii]|uniref:Phox homologous domain n=1 Tax=Plasmopara halstedii TaxID=4781 RepID=A0A0P1ATZ3_PLAHL|nr:Phox homologous domain [Plasmopara halstedii]CEG44846.1 Phox homologous domain [Plasmopara halstedii]|eukprot:XP_024581215.1 Phox homologous domain [Plasmopara halstedii]